MTATSVDIAILGGGCAGLQLIEQLAAHTSWESKRVALLSDGVPQQRSWCFWSQEAHPLQNLVEKSWGKVSFRAKGVVKTESILPFKYHYIAGESFFKYFKEDFLPKQANLNLIQAPVTSLEGNETGFRIEAGSQSWQAKQVFSSINADSTCLKSGDRLEQSANHTLLQHFKGWFLKTSTPVFDDSTVILMDFSVPQDNDVRFVYVLPFSPSEALVEMTVFSPTTYPEATYDAVLKQYMTDNYATTDYIIDRTEVGKILMTDALFSRYGTEGEVLIGSAAGMVKPTTGYAFKRIGRDSRQLAESVRTQSPLKWQATSGRFRFYDRLLLGILTETPLLGSVIFTQLFSKIPIQTVLRFLDEETSLWEEIKIFARLPFAPFLKQVIKQAFR